MNYLIIYLMVFIGLNVNDGITRTRSSSMCTKLALDHNRLLQSPDTNLQIKRQCRITPHLHIHTMRRPPIKGCLYNVPSEWAQAISYPRLTGLILRNKDPEAICPSLSFKQFEKITYEGKLDGWRTEQTNTIKRLLRLPSEDTPSPSMIIPMKELTIGEFMIDKLMVRLVIASKPIERGPIASEGNFYYDK